MAKFINDLHNDALADAENKSVTERRAHFHVPIFINHYGVLESTQKDIEEVLSINKIPY